MPGIRNLTDFDYEAQMAAMNRKLRPRVEAVFLLPDAPLRCISSTLVREISKLGGDIGRMRGLFPANRAKKVVKSAFHAYWTGATSYFSYSNSSLLFNLRIFISRKGRYTISVTPAALVTVLLVRTSPRPALDVTRASTTSQFT